jgi:uncharacterized membrane protein (DUF373 family)
MRSPLDLFKQVIIYVLVVLLCILAVFLIAGLFYALIQSIYDPGTMVDIREATLTYVGEILLVVIIIELIDTIMVYWKEHTVKVGSVLLVALTAVSRELIIFDYHEGEVEILIGTSLGIFALAFAIYVMSRSGRSIGLDGPAEAPEE